MRGTRAASLPLRAGVMLWLWLQAPLALARTCIADFPQLYGELFEDVQRVLTDPKVFVDAVAGGGGYALQDGFGWTNGVLRKLLVLYPDAAVPTANAPPAN